jgi:hypothetical protein
MHHLRTAEKARGERVMGTRSCDWENYTDEQRAEDERLFQIYRNGIACAQPRLRQIAKEKATTPAGIYAKALVVRASRTGAKHLAMTLAEDLVNYPALRAAIWPADTAREEPVSRPIPGWIR